MTVKTEIDEKTRQNTENKQTFDLTAKIKIEEKTRQTDGNKQTLDLTAKIEIDGNSRQNAENKQTYVIILQFTMVTGEPKSPRMFQRTCTNLLYGGQNTSRAITRMR